METFLCKLKLLQSHQEYQRLQKPQWIRNDFWYLNLTRPSINWRTDHLHAIACQCQDTPASCGFHLLLSCPAMNWLALLTRVRDIWGHPVLHAASPLLWSSVPPKPTTLKSTWEQTGSQAHCNKQSPPSECFIKIVIINSKCLWKLKWGIWQGAEGRRRHLGKDSALLNTIPSTTTCSWRTNPSSRDCGQVRTAYCQ